MQTKGKWTKAELHSFAKERELNKADFAEP